MGRVNLIIRISTLDCLTSFFISSETKAKTGKKKKGNIFILKLAIKIHSQIPQVCLK